MLTKLIKAIDIFELGTQNVINIFLLAVVFGSVIVFAFLIFRLMSQRKEKEK